MAKTALFRKALFGFSKEDVNAYISRQDHRVRELSAEVEGLRSRFEAWRVFYDNLMTAYGENLKVLQEVQLRAAHNAQSVRELSGVFAALSEEYRALFSIASEMNSALATAKLYEQKACRYDDLARQMQLLVLPENAPELSPLVPLPQVRPLPAEETLGELSQKAEASLKEMLADADAFYSACVRLRNPAPPEQTSDPAVV